MSVIRIIAALSLLAPLSAIASYDPGRIKEGLMQDGVFQIQGWESSQAGWRAQTDLRGVSLKLQADRLEMLAPYINNTQKNAALDRCETLGEIVLAAQTDQDREAIARVVKSAAQHHLTKFTDMNGMRFEVTPVLKGPYVRLSCVARKYS